MSSVDPPAASGQLDFVGALLVADTRAFVSEWREFVAVRAGDFHRDSAREDGPLLTLRERSQTLQLRARAAGVGGLAHHLALGEECLLDECAGDRLEECLANILELVGQLEQELGLQRGSSPVVSSVEAEAVEPPSGDGASESPGPVEPVSGTPLPAPVAVPWRGWKRMPLAAEPAPEAVRTSVAEEGTVALSQVLGLTPVGPSAAVAAPDALAAEPAADLGAEAAAELLAAEFVVAEDDDELTDQDLEIPLHLSRRTVPVPLLLSQHEVAIELPPPTAAFFRRRRLASRQGWGLALLALGVAGSVVGLALVFLRSGATNADVRGDGTPVTSSGALLPQPHSSGSEKGLYVLLAQAHGHGSESPQLGQLIDDEAAAIAKAMTEPCAPGSLACELAEQGQLLLEPKPPAAPPLEGATARAASQPAAGLAGLHAPAIGLPSDAQLEQALETQTKDAVGHEMFQSLLFQCATFQQLFQGALTERGLPLDLAAVVMVESGCKADTESPIGGQGLWHLTRARARAYRLRVQPLVIDERLNAAKATEAALDLLRDLRTKLGSWPLALASYQLGPFNVVARMRQSGANADYAALVSEGRLPLDTLNYVAKVQAFALILANLEHFQFTGPPERAGSNATTLLVPAGTRLSLVARAVGSSAIRIRELNPELIAELVPGPAGEGFSLQVPGDGGPSAREQLVRLLARSDRADECVPLSFDWGRQQLTRAMLSRCKRDANGRAVASGRAEQR